MADPIRCVFSSTEKEQVKIKHETTSYRLTLPETNIAPENGWLEDDFPFGKPYFQVLCYFHGG